jgi:hypothetical protein
MLLFKKTKASNPKASGGKPTKNSAAGGAAASATKVAVAAPTAATKPSVSGAALDDYSYSCLVITINCLTFRL